jgi:hypothetical protein
MVDVEVIERRDADHRRRILERVLHEQHEAVVAMSPPGSGKTELVESAAVLNAHDGGAPFVVTPRNEQVYDFVRRVLDDYGAPVTLLHATDSEPIVSRRPTSRHASVSPVTPATLPATSASRSRPS